MRMQVESTDLYDIRGVPPQQLQVHTHKIPIDGQQTKLLYQQSWYIHA